MLEFVKVNDVVVTELGTKITRQDKVEFNDKPVQIESKVYIVLNKPKNCVTTSDDPQERLTVMDLVKNACQERIYPVGRLDRNTTGVLLLTNDGDLASKLTHPSFKKKKIYHVWLDKNVSKTWKRLLTDWSWKTAKSMQMQSAMQAKTTRARWVSKSTRDVTVSFAVSSNHWDIM